MTAHRLQFHEDMRTLEEQTLAGLDMVVTQLDGSIKSITHQDVELAAKVVADDAQIDRCYLDDETKEREATQLLETMNAQTTV